MVDFHVHFIENARISFHQQPRQHKTTMRKRRLQRDCIFILMLDATDGMKHSNNKLCSCHHLPKSCSCDNLANIFASEN